MTTTQIASTDTIRRSLAVRDLTNPDEGPHAMQVLLDEIESALAARWGIPVLRRRLNPVVSVEENYDRLRYPHEAIARDARYTRYLTPDLVLRTHTSAMIPRLLDQLSAQALPDVALSCPGVVYRRDAIDREHVGEPHQIDLWRIRTDGPQLGRNDLDDMVATIVRKVLPGRAHRSITAAHPYTVGGLQIDVSNGTRWIEIGECGLAHPAVLREAKLPASSSGLAMGLGLDRLLMLRKGIDDIRILRSTDPRIAGQMLDLSPYQPVSTMPSVRRDISIAVSGDVDEERLGDRVREALGDRAAVIEAVEVLASTRDHELSHAARKRIGLRPGQTNVLLRIVLRALERTLTAGEANKLRDDIYAAIHEGEVHQWASNPAQAGCS
jgi:phenylalanyl-tRNA synthetase alpha chain